MDGMENRGWMEWIDEDFDKDEKYTEEFTDEWRVDLLKRDYQ